MKFKTGDIVIKTTGGNKMTIDSFNGGLYKCIWFLESHLYQFDFKEDEIITLHDYKKLLKTEERDDKINQILDN